MNTTRFLPVLALTAAVLSGCGGVGGADLPFGSAAYRLMPPGGRPVLPAQRIGPGDLLSVRVFQEPELSHDKLLVSASGHIQLPLAGEVLAAGLSAPELAAVIAGRLGRDYLRDPQVTVAVIAPRQPLVTVEGEVKLPGVYPLNAGDTLLSAIARAQSPSRVARLDEVIVFRHGSGERTGARFDLRAIRTGRAPDPLMLDGDVVVVGYSALQGAYRDFLQAAPLFNVFTQF